MENDILWNIFTTCYLGMFKKNETLYFLNSIFNFFCLLIDHYDELANTVYQKYSLNQEEIHRLNLVLIKSELFKYLDSQIEDNFKDVK